MLSYIDSARAGALDAGHAYAAGGRRAPEAENGVLMGGTKADASQRFDDFPGEHPSQGEPYSSTGLGRALPCTFGA